MRYMFRTRIARAQISPQPLLCPTPTLRSSDSNVEVSSAALQTLTIELLFRAYPSFIEYAFEDILARALGC